MSTIYKSRGPKSGPWIVPANEATGSYISTCTGPVPIADFIPKAKLRSDQTNHKSKFNPGHHAGY